MESGSNYSEEVVIPLDHWKQILPDCGQIIPGTIIVHRPVSEETINVIMKALKESNRPIHIEVI
jgi:hypothetical protein